MTQILEFTNLNWLHLKEPWNPHGNKLFVWKASDITKLKENMPHYEKFREMKIIIDFVVCNQYWCPTAGIA